MVVKTLPLPASVSQGPEDDGGMVLVALHEGGLFFSSAAGASRRCSSERCCSHAVRLQVVRRARRFRIYRTDRTCAVVRVMGSGAR